MKITYFYRNQRAGFSIAKVMNIISKEISKNECVEEYYVPEYRASFWGILRNLFFVYRNRNKDGINHVTGDIHYCIFALVGCKSVLTIHDLVAYKFVKNKIKRRVLKLLWFDLPILLADKVICISETIKNELIEISDRKDIVFIHNALAPDFYKSINDFNSNKPCILQIGTNWNKNVDNLVRSIKNIKCTLRIIGVPTLEILNDLTINNIDFSYVTNLTDEDVIEEYKNCDIVSFCSIYEGFGMPIIEANAVGRCVITSNINPMVEVAGEAAYLVDPYDCESICNGLNDIINNATVRNRLISNGFQNIERFNGKVCAEKYLSIYRDLLKSR